MIEITFQLRHKNKNELTLYENRSLAKDSEEIINLIKDDTLFNAYEVTGQTNHQNYSVDVKIKGLSLPNNAQAMTTAQEYLIFCIDNKLAGPGLTKHFFISSMKIVFRPNAAIFSIKYFPEQLIMKPSLCELQVRLDKINFPSDRIPEKYLCSIISCLMDIPYYDRRQPEIHYDNDALFRMNYNKSHLNPYLRKPLELLNIKIDYILRDEILTLVEKAEYCSKNNISCSKYIKDIIDPNISSVRFQIKLLDENKSAKDISKSEVQTFIDKGLKSYSKKRYIAAIYWLEKVFENKNKLNSNDKQLIEAINILIQAYVDKNLLKKALEKIFEIEKKNGGNISALLLNKANIYINLAKYEDAIKILTETLKKDLKGDELRIFNRLCLLTRFKVRDNYLEHCKGLRRAAAYGSNEEFRFYLESFPEIEIDSSDNKKNYTSLHYVVEKGNLKKTKILFGKNAKLNVSNKDGITAFHLLSNNKNTNFSNLVKPFMSFHIKSQNFIGLFESNENTLKNELGLSSESRIIFIKSESRLIVTKFSLNQKVQIANFLDLLFAKIKCFDNFSNLRIESITYEKNKSYVVKDKQYQICLKFSVLQNKLYSLYQHIISNSSNVQNYLSNNFFPTVDMTKLTNKFASIIVPKLLAVFRKNIFDQEGTYSKINTSKNLADFTILLERCPSNEFTGKIFSSIAAKALKETGLHTYYYCSKIAISELPELNEASNFKSSIKI